MISEQHHGHRSAFLQEVIEETPGGERLMHCLQCGSCGGSCPNGADMQYTPRAIFAMIAGDRREAVLKSNTMWYCVSCYFCTTRCPQQIPITELMYTLKRKSIASGLAQDTDAPALAKTFTDLVEKYGRSFEFGLASRFHFFNKPMSAPKSMLKMGKMGFRMFTRGRIHLTPNKIRQMDQLTAIINKAKEIGGTS
jgi:heterodisulfide reductase subunit C